MSEQQPRRRPRVWLWLVTVAIVWLFTPGRVVLDAAWGVVNTSLFWTLASFALVGVLLVRLIARAVRATQRAARAARDARDRALDRRDDRRHRAAVRDAYGATLDDIRQLPEIRRVR